MIIFSIILSFGIWFLLYKLKSKNLISIDKILLLIVSVGFAIRLSYLIFTPTFYAPDEQSHFNYVKYLSEKSSLPIQNSRTNDISNDWEYYQPPLYYLTLTPIYYVSNIFFDDLDLIIKVLRFTTLLFWIILVIYAYKFIISLQINNNIILVSIFSFIGLLPTYSYSSAMINNDNLLIALGAIILYYSLQKITLKNSIIIGILLGLAIITKLSGAIFFIYFLIFYLINLLYKKIEFKKLLNLLLLLSIGFIMWLPFGFRNLEIYGSFSAEEIANIPYQWDSISQALISTTIYLQKSFWAISGIHNNISSYFPILGILLLVIAAYGLVYQFFVDKNMLSIKSNNFDGLFLIFLISFLILTGLIYRFGFLYAQSQGRFLFPLLIPISIIFGIGLNSFKISHNENSYIHIAGIFIIYAFTFLGYTFLKISLN